MTLQIEKITTGKGPLSDEDYIHALANTYWVYRLACGLELVTLAEDIDDAHSIARTSLRELVDPIDGLRVGVDDSAHLRWRLACREPKPKREREE